MKKLSELSVVLPCYNEEGNVERVVNNCLKIIPKFAKDFEIIVVNDGSKDKTGEIADKLAAKNKKVVVVHHPKNRGYGAALRSGFYKASKEWVFYTDGDGQFDLNDLAEILPLLDKYDIVSGYRKKRRDPFIRKVNAFLWTSLVRLLFGIPLRDVDCAFKIYPRKMFQQMELYSEGALIDTEVLAKAKLLRYRIGETGVNHLPRVAGKQTGAKLSVIIKAFKELFKLRMRIKKEIHPDTN